MTTAPAELAGRMGLRTGGGALPAITSSRPDLVPRLTRGRPAAQLPALLGAVFTLCSQAHRWTARRAVAAAQGMLDAAAGADLQAHRLATLREQILRISHDWPRLLPDVPGRDDAQTLLRTCPLWRQDLPADQRLALLPAWLAQRWLGMSHEAWLAAYEADPAGWPARWAHAGQGPVARLMGSQRVAAQALAAAGPALDLLDDAPLAMPLLARDMAARPHFCRQPDWQGEVPDTGPWNRRADPLRRPALTAWDRLVARLLDVLRLAAADGAHWLGHGALGLGAGEGLAWTEMARGLLVHRVRLAEVPGGAPVVVDCQVLAPTEWNFHPQGVLAAALRRLPAGPASAPAATRLAVAFDPCVAFDVAGGAAMGDDASLNLETRHA